MLGFISWIAGFITKLIVPILLGWFVTETIMRRRFHFRYHGGFVHPYIAATGNVITLIGVFNLILDIFYCCDIRSLDFMNRAIDYFIIQNHTTIYSMIRFGLEDKPFRTKVFIGYMIVAALIAVFFIGVIISDSLEAERKI